MFTITVEKLKALLTILLVSGYAGLPRQEMYLERQEDCYNLAVSTVMTETGFSECKRYLHWLIITVSIVQVNLRKCHHYLMLLTHNAF